jgi:hypothetical protein
LFRPQYPRLRAALRLVSDVAGIVTFYFLLQAGEFIVANPGANLGASLTDPVNIGNHVFTVGQIANYAVALAPLITLIVFFLDALVEGTRLLRALRRPPAIVTQSNGIL